MAANGRVAIPKRDSMVRPEPATERGRETRRRLLAAAEEVFGERGYHQAGIVDITQRANVAPGTFYVHFADKRAIFGELVRALNRMLRAEIRAAIEGLDDRVEQEIVGFETFFRFVLRHRNLYQVIRQAEWVDPALLRWHYDTLAAGYVAGLRKAQRRGQIRSDLDPEALAWALMGIAEAYGMRWVLWDGRVPDAEVAATLRATIATMLRGSLEGQR